MIVMILRWLVVITPLLTPVSAADMKPFDHDYAAWDSIAKNHVRWLPDNVQSRVNYTGIKKDGAFLAHALGEFSAVSQAEFDKWNTSQQMAFLINAYNAFTVDLILTKFPEIHSIKDLGGLFESPWKQKFFSLLGAKHHLDWIEHEMLRARYQDPRIHTAIVCASIGCPALRSEAYTATRLDAQMEDSMRRFVSDKTRNRYREGKLEVSSIFKWFREDFEKGYQGFKSIEDVFARYAENLTIDPQAQSKIRAKSVPITFLDYDWLLNDSAR